MIMQANANDDCLYINEIPSTPNTSKINLYYPPNVCFNSYASYNLASTQWKCIDNDTFALEQYTNVANCTGPASTTKYFHRSDGYDMNCSPNGIDCSIKWADALAYNCDLSKIEQYAEAGFVATKCSNNYNETNESIKQIACGYNQETSYRVTAYWNNADCSGEPVKIINKTDRCDPIVTPSAYYKQAITCNVPPSNK